MELTQKHMAERLDGLRRLMSEDPTAFSKLGQRLHEKGVECAIILPLIEVLLEFNALEDVQYEQASETRHGQRFDFLIEGRFLIECKALGANLDDHYAQVRNYIKSNDAISYGILTNGVDFQFWLQRSFIEEKSNARLPHAETVTPVLEISLEADSIPILLNTLSLFNKSQYHGSFETMARIAGYYGGGGRGRPPILHQDREHNALLTERIRNAVEVKKGVYYDDVTSGKLDAGQQLRFSDGCVEITVEVTETGTVLLRKGGANILDMVNALDAGWDNLVQLIAAKWAREDTEFQDPLEIVKLALDRQRLRNRERYTFDPV